MANFSTVTNAQFDTALNAAPAPFAPVTRVDNVPSVSPNSHIPIRVTSSYNHTFYLSYNDLQDAERLRRLLYEAHASLNIMHLELADFARAVLAISDKHVTTAMPDAEYARLINTLRYTQRLAALVPIKAWDEVNVDKGIRFTHAVTGTGLTRTVTITAPVNVDYVAVYWGDDTSDYAVVSGPSTALTHTYAASGSRTLRIIAAGPGGVLSKTQTITV